MKSMKQAYMRDFSPEYDDTTINLDDESPINDSSIPPVREESNSIFGRNNKFGQDFNDEFKDDEFKDDMFGGGMSGGGIPGEMPMERHGDLLKDLTDFDSYIRELINGWLGRYWDMEQGKYVNNPFASPIMNEKCATWCITFLRTYTRKNNILTNISKGEYDNFIEDVIEVVWLNIGLRKKEFGIVGNGDVLRVCTELQHAIELVLMGAGSGKYGSILTGVYNRTEGGMQPAREKSGGVLTNALQKTKNWLLG